MAQVSRALFDMVGERVVVLVPHLNAWGRLAVLGVAYGFCGVVVCCLFGAQAAFRACARRFRSTGRRS